MADVGGALWLMGEEPPGCCGECPVAVVEVPPWPSGYVSVATVVLLNFEDLEVTQVPIVPEVPETCLWSTACIVPLLPWEWGVLGHPKIPTQARVLES